jgi:HD-GYP domain-containing protein (c-di-GMP phosphodiesterase class II)
MVRNEQVQSWLLALNRTNGHGLANGDFAEPCSSLEFGTDEATLLSVAAAMLSTHAGNIELFREKERLLTDVVSALVYAIEAKDNYTCGHSQRVASFGKSLARHCGLDEENCDRVYLAGLLHDVGKIGVNDAALKKPGALTPEEYAEIKKHPDGAWAILQTLKPLEYILPGVLFHHERFDGKGYPDGLAGNEIPLAGRILAVTDSYDAMTSDRPYRKGMPPEKAAAILSQGAGSQWDPTVVEAFLHILPDIVQTQNAFRPPARPQRAKGAVEATNCQPQSGWQMGNGKWRSGNGGWGAWSGGSAAGVAR